MHKYKENYRDVNKINSGSYGDVWKVIDSQDNHFAAKKIDDVDLDAAKKEATLLKLMSDNDIGPKVPDIFFYYDDDDDKCVLVMELMDSDLQTYMITGLNNKTLDIEFVMTEVTRLMRESSDLGIVCTDQKPKNYLVKTKDGAAPRIRMADFDGEFCCQTRETCADLTYCNLAPHHTSASNLVTLLLVQIAITAGPDLGLFKEQIQSAAEMIASWKADGDHAFDDLSPIEGDSYVSGARNEGEEISKAISSAMRQANFTLSHYAHSSDWWERITERNNTIQTLHSIQKANEDSYNDVSVIDGMSDVDDEPPQRGTSRSTPNVFATGVAAYGMWWLSNIGVIRTATNHRSRGLLYIRAEPNSVGLHIVHIFYDPFESSQVSTFLAVKYHIDVGRNKYSATFVHEEDLQHTFPFRKKSNVRTMQDVIDEFAGQSPNYRKDNPCALVGFRPTPELLLMFSKLMIGDTQGNPTEWNINIHRFPSGNEIVVGLEPDE